MTTEVWRPVFGLESTYEVSDAGRVRSLDRVQLVRRGEKMVPQRYAGRVRRTHVNDEGYHRVSLSKGDGSSISVSVHVLVLEAFVSPRPDGLEALHINGDPGDNTPSNLRWGTHAENVQDALRHGTHVAHPGSRNGRALLTEADIPEIRRRLRTEFPAAIARDYGVNRSTIQQIKRGQNWSHVPADNDNHSQDEAA